MTKLRRPRCHVRQCVHYRGVAAVRRKRGLKHVHVCAAFPDASKGGIPVDIAYGDNDHLEPVPGDNGIVYERFHGPYQTYSQRPAMAEAGGGWFRKLREQLGEPEGGEEGLQQG